MGGPQSAGVARIRAPRAGRATSFPPDVDWASAPSLPRVPKGNVSHGAGATKAMNRSLLYFSLCVVSLLAGCASNVQRLRFDPNPAGLEIRPDPEGPVRATGLVSVIEGRRADSKSPPVLWIRVRLENESSEPLTLNVDELELVASSLAPFGPVQAVPPAFEIAPGAARTWDLGFAYPPGLPLSADGLDGLSLRMGLTWSGGSVTVRVPFTRAWPRYGYYPYPYGYPYGYGPNWSVGVGVSIH